MAQWLRLGGDTWRHLAEQSVPSIYVHLAKKRAVQWQLKPTFSRRKTLAEDLLFARKSDRMSE